MSWSKRAAAIMSTSNRPTLTDAHIKLAHPARNRAFTAEGIALLRRPEEHGIRLRVGHLDLIAATPQSHDSCCLLRMPTKDVTSLRCWCDWRLQVAEVALLSALVCIGNPTSIYLRQITPILPVVQYASYIIIRRQLDLTFRHASSRPASSGPSRS